MMALAKRSFCAWSLLVAAVSITPGCRPSTGSLLGRAKEAEGKGRHEDSCRLLGRALQRGDLGAGRRFAALRARLRCAHRTGHLAAVQAEAQAAATRRPGDAEPRYILGLSAVLAADGRSADAARHLKEAARLDPSEAEYPYRLGLLHLAAERPKEAALALEEALRLRPHWAAPRVALARAHAEQGDARAARRILESLADCAPSMSQVSEASSILETLARDADPIPPEARPLFDQAMKLLGEEFTAAASGVLKKAHEEHPQVATFALLYGLAMVRLSNYGAALTLLGEAARLNPEDPSAPLHYASVLQELGRTKDSIAHFEAATRLDPVSRRAWQGLGEALLSQKRVEEALPALKRAAALSGRDPAVLRSLGQALAAAGRVEEATGLAREALRRKPADVELRFELAELLVRSYRSTVGNRSADKLISEARALLETVVKDAPEHEAARTLLRRLTATAEGKERPAPRRKR
ncbi:MAG: tetratricopeptide repeat protein [Polyangia bacterium]|jgi:tetratricopeptide (TPR) repeat protein|nr:tetratricopeptide repeat protein [Polyangia bacterium]